MHLGTILIRADASVEIGTGHVMRCLALAQAWQDAGGTAEFAMAESTPAILGRVAGFRVSSVQAAAGSTEDAGSTTEIARANRAEWIVADGYLFGRDYQHRIKDAGLKLLCVDDNAEAGSFFADVVLNQNLHARESLYRERKPGARLLLGPKYALLRREFKAWQGWRREIPAEARRVLVTMGGSDALNLSEPVIRAIQLLNIPELETTVVAGGSNPHTPSLQMLAEESEGRLRLAVDANNMPDLMAWADIAVSAAGSTCWEMCRLGLPAILIDVAENQRPIAEGLTRLGISIYSGSADGISVEKVAADIESLLLSSECRSAMSRRGRELVDGEGSCRVVSELQPA
jgi:UDP-2,4-diacetamido-2,4,6-trideoxy-beta-L-altropyranose hydrolase